MKVFLLTLFFSAAVFSKNIELNSTNHVFINAKIDDGSMFKAQVRLYNLVAARGEKDYPIYIVMRSPGGYIHSGLSFIESTKSLKNVETITIFAASMASAIVEALPGKRYILDTGVMMFHRARGGFQGQFEDGEVESRLAFSKSMVRHMEAVNAERMGISLKKYKELVKDELWLFGENAVLQKAADETVSITCADDILYSNPTTCPLFYLYKE